MPAPEQWLSAYRAPGAIGVTARTLRNWEQAGIIKAKRSPTGQRIYDVSSLRLRVCGPRGEQGERPAGEYIAYARVSSAKQKDDLERQVAALRAQFPQHKVVRDVGSGINWKRPGLRAVVQHCLRGTLRELVVAHRDRLSRLAFDLLEFIVTQSGAKLTVLDRGEGSSADDELGEDLLSIVHVFSCRHYGKRKYAKRRRVDEPASEKAAEEGTEGGGGGAAAPVPEDSDRTHCGPADAPAEDLRHP